MDTEFKRVLEERLKASGWTVESDMPLELRHEDGSFYTGKSASNLLDILREEAEMGI